MDARPLEHPRPPVTLNVTLTAGDWRHAQHVLPHQLRRLAGQVDEVQLVLNVQPGSPRTAAEQEQHARIRTLLDASSAAWPHLRVQEVDYAPEARAAVAERFYGGRPVPLTNHDGGPFYSYWYGWHTARHDLVLHTDSDMLFGGGSQTWVAEAVALLREREDVLTVSPLSGPPTADGDFPPAVAARHAKAGGQPVREALPHLAHRLHGVSTRLWLFDRVELVRRVGPVPLRQPPMRSQARALLEGHPRYQLPERVLTQEMNRHGLRRIDLLGSEPGMWSLHPAMRSDTFYERLPEVVARVEAGDVPDAQRGDYDLNDSLVDWTSARQALRQRVWWRRVGRALRSLPSR